MTRPTLPADFERQMNNLLGTEAAGRLFSALADEPVVSLRQNPARNYSPPSGAAPVPWCDGGFYLTQRPAFTLDPCLHAGCYYVQEAASMFVAQAFRTMTEAPRRLLDLCAAPGGKSTLWRSLLPEGALLVANEPLRQRAMVLAENLAKWGHPDVMVTNGWPADFGRLTGFFDVVAADVPCSGEGMFRKDEGAAAEWSAANVTACAERQRQIIGEVWPALRQGGYLVYSTCTFNREENEDNICYICHELGAEPVPISCEAAWGITGDTTGRNLPVYHFLPGTTRGEGFFLALLRKTAPAETATPRRHRNTGAKERPVAGGRTVAAWLDNNSAYKLYRPDDTHIAAMRQELAADMERVRAAVCTLRAGVLLAEEKGRKLIPQQELALSTALSPGAFPEVELPPDEALAYLRREALVLPPETPRGYVLTTFGGHRLGFLNNLGARANNLYPAEWRIRKLLPGAAQAPAPRG